MKDFFTEKRILIYIFVFALILRLLMLNLHSVIETDGTYYVRMAENLFSGHGLVDIENQFQTSLAPFYPIMIGFFNLFADGELAARLVSILFGALLIFPVYFIARRLFSRKTALITALVVSVYPALAYISTITYTDSLFLFLLFTSILVFIKFLDNESIYNALLLGFTLSLTYLTRPEGFTYLLITIFLTFIIKSKNLKEILPKVFAIILVFFLVASPYLAFLKEQTGSFSLSSKGYVIYKFREFNPYTQEYEKNIFSLNQDKTDIRLNPYTVKGSLIVEILSNFSIFIERYVRNFIAEIFKSLPMLFPLFPLSILGLVNRKKRGINLALLLFAAYTIFFFPIFWVESRYLLPILPLLIMWAAESTSVLEIIVNKKLLIAGFSVLILALLVSNVFANHLIDKRFEKLNPPIEHKQAGLMLKQYYSNPIVMSRKPYVSFYASGSYVNLPYASLKDTLDFACYKNVQFLVADSRYSSLRPELMKELENSTLEKVYNKENIVIYKLSC